MKNQVKTIKITKQQLLNLSYDVAEADKRINRKKIHSAESIIFITLAAVICGAESWTEVAYFSGCKESLWKKLFPGFITSPSHDTFSRFFSSLDPNKFEESFRKWIRNIMGDLKYKGVIAIDGKSIRNSGSEAGKDEADKSDEPGKYSKLHIVSAFATSLGISLGQLKTEEKSNEITIIPELIKAIDIDGCIITIDAMGCQKEIAKTIVENNGDYVLVVKDNQKKLKKAIKGAVRDASLKRKSRVYSCATSYDDARGRIEERTCEICKEKYCLGGIINVWENINTVAKITSKRADKKTGKTSEQTRYIISSLKDVNAMKILEYSRAHWAVENNLHWQLDVSFNEDNDRKKNVSAQNFSVICKMALAVLKQDTTKKIGIRGKRKIAGWSDLYLCELIDGL